MDYMIISNCFITGLEDSINKYLANGWKLSGGVATAMGETGIIYYQAIVKQGESES